MSVRNIRRNIERTREEEFTKIMNEAKAQCYVYHSAEFKLTTEVLDSIRALDREYGKALLTREMRIPEKGMTDFYAWLYTEEARDAYAKAVEEIIGGI